MTRRRKLIYSVIAFVALVGSMELSRPHTETVAPLAVVTLKTEPVHVLTEAEQACAMVSSPIPDCVAVLSSMPRQTTRFDPSMNLPMMTKGEREEFETKQLMNTLHRMAGERTE